MVIGKFVIFLKFQLSLAKRMRIYSLSIVQRYIVGEVNGSKGNFYTNLRGIGELKILKHKKSGFIRILVRAEKTHKCIVNHLIQAKDIFCKLEQMKTSNNAWTWAAYDISDEKPES